MQTLWILGDQLLPDHPGLRGSDPRETVILMIEAKARGTQVRYHQQKLVLVFAAMRHYAEQLRAQGWTVDYHELVPDFAHALAAHVQRYHPQIVRVLEPNDHSTTAALPRLARSLGVNLEWIPTTMFLISRSDFRDWAGKRKTLLMEQHYRRVRLKHQILLTPTGEPEGGAWNFDADNRRTFAQFAKEQPSVPPPPKETSSDVTQAVIELVRREFPNHPGDARGFWLPVTREAAQRWLREFVRTRLEHFGPWEDLMVEGQPVLYHSVLSPALNLGLLTPQECVDAALEAYRAGRAPLASVEGFVRQIIGWREFINGIYWTRGPEYLELNALHADRPLPTWLYTGETELNCVRSALQQALARGYNHHIQRLMVLGNFFLLGGYRPREVYRWYLEMYVDAYDWVMAANVIGMILYADGGYFATKPYAAGPAYLSKMGNACAGCRYRPEIKTGPQACPFHALYWNFYAQHEARLASNPRVAMMLSTWRKKSNDEQRSLRTTAERFLEKVGS